MKLNFRPLVATLSAAALLAACSGSGATPQQMLTNTKANVSIQTSVHFFDVTTQGGSNKSITGDISPQASQETLTVDKTLILQLRLIGTTAYVASPSAKVLVTTLGVTESQAAGLTNKWISLISTDAPYNEIVKSLSIDSEISGFFPPATSVKALPTKSISKLTVVPLTGYKAYSATAGEEVTLFVGQKSSLPVGATSVAKSGKVTSNRTAAFKDWGATIKVVTPTDATAFSSI